MNVTPHPGAALPTVMHALFLFAPPHGTVFRCCAQYLSSPLPHLSLTIRPLLCVLDRRTEVEGNTFFRLDTRMMALVRLSQAVCSARDPWHTATLVAPKAQPALFESHARPHVYGLHDLLSQFHGEIRLDRDIAAVVIHHDDWERYSREATEFGRKFGCTVQRSVPAPTCCHSPIGPYSTPVAPASPIPAGTLRSDRLRELEAALARKREERKRREARRKHKRR